MADEIPQSLIDFFAKAERGGSPATEETLQRIADALGAKKGPGTGAAGKQAKGQENLAKAAGKATSSFDELSDAAGKSSDKLNDLGSELKSGGRQLTRSTQRLADSADGMRDIFDTLGETSKNIMGQFGKIGRAAGGAIGGITALGSFAIGAAVKTQESFNTAAQAGANFGGSLLELKKASDTAGMPLSQFTEAVKNNASSLSLFSGSVNRGAKDFAEVGKAIRDTDLQRSLMSMGISLKEQPEFLASFMGNMGRFGMDLADFGGDFKQVAKTAVGFRKELEIARNLTGETNEEQQAAMDALAKDAQLQAKLRQEGGQAVAEYAALQAQVPEALRPVLRDLRLFGTVTEDSAGAAAMFPKQVEIMQQSMNNADPAQAFRNLAERNAGALQAELEASYDAIAVSGKTSSAALQQAQGMFVEYQQFVDRLMGGAVSAAEGDMENATDGVVPDGLTGAMFQLQETSNDVQKAMEELGTTMLGDDGAVKLMQGFAKAIETGAEAMPKLIDKFTKWGNSLTGLDPSTLLLGAAGAAGIAATMAPLLVKPIVGAIATGFTRAANLIRTADRKSSRRGAGPGAGGVAGAGAGYSEDHMRNKSKASWMDKLKKGVRGAAPLALLMGAMDMYGIATDDSLSTKEKFREGSGVAGGTAGAAAGGAAGAAIGTMIFPGIGTVLGGLAGGALGYFGGSEAGKGIFDSVSGWFGGGEEETTAPRGGPGAGPARPGGAPSAGPTTPSSAAPSTAPTAATPDSGGEDRTTNPFDQFIRVQQEQMATLKEILKAVKDGSTNEVDALKRIMDNI